MSSAWPSRDLAGAPERAVGAVGGGGYAAAGGGVDHAYADTGPDAAALLWLALKEGDK